MSGNTEISAFTFNDADIVHVRAGRHRTRRVVPPAGEDHAFDVVEWDHRIEVYVSPQGRSVRVFMDGEELTG